MSFREFGGGTSRNAARGGSDTIGEDDSEYRKLSERCSHALFVISNNVTTIEKLSNDYGTAKDTQKLRDNIHNLQSQTRTLIQDASKDMKKLLGRPQHPNDKVKKLAQAKLDKDFTNVLQRFQLIEKHVAHKSREYVTKARASLPNENTKQQDDSEDETQPLLNDSSQSHKMQQLNLLDNQVEYNEALIREREDDLMQIENSITEVNEIFRDLGTLVHEQGTMLDNIENNVESIAVNMENATGELQRASDYQKRARRRALFCTMILVIVGLVVVLIVLS